MSTESSGNCFIICEFFGTCGPIPALCLWLPPCRPSRGAPRGVGVGVGVGGPGPRALEASPETGYSVQFFARLWTATHGVAARRPSRGRHFAVAASGHRRRHRVASYRESGPIHRGWSGASFYVGRSSRHRQCSLDSAHRSAASVRRSAGDPRAALLAPAGTGPTRQSCGRWPGTCDHHPRSPSHRGPCPRLGWPRHAAPPGRVE